MLKGWIFINWLTIQYLWSEYLKILIFKLYTWNNSNSIVLTDDLVQVDPICQRGRFVFVWKIECQDLVILNDPELSNYQLECHISDCILSRNSCNNSPEGPVEFFFRTTIACHVNSEEKLFEINWSIFIRVKSPAKKSVNNSTDSAQSPEHVVTELCSVALGKTFWVDLHEALSVEFTIWTVRHESSVPFCSEQSTLEIRLLSL